MFLSDFIKFPAQRRMRIASPRHRLFD